MSVNQPAQSLTEKQQRFSLSGAVKSKTAGPGNAVRNVLAKPFDNFWPVVDNNDTANELKILLLKFLPSAKKIVGCEDLEMLRKLRGKKNFEKRREMYRTVNRKNSDFQHFRKCLALGINEVSSALEKSNLTALLIANEADPPLLTRHLGTLAAFKEVPYVVLPGLKDFTKSALGFSCLALGLKKDVDSEENVMFSQLHLKILSAVKAIAEELAKSGLKSYDSASHSEVMEVCPSPNSSQISHNCRAECETSSCETIETQMKSMKPFNLSSSRPVFETVKNIYLFRRSKHYRVFVPGKVGDIPSSEPQYLSLSSLNQNSKGEGICINPKSGKIPLGSELVSNVPFKRQVQMKNVDAVSKPREAGKISKPLHVTRYFQTNLAPLKVKKIQGNPNKIKKQKQKTKITGK